MIPTVTCIFLFCSLVAGGGTRCDATRPVHALEEMHYVTAAPIGRLPWQQPRYLTCARRLQELRDASPVADEFVVRFEMMPARAIEVAR